MVAVPSNVAPLKNSTLLTVPSLSLALALSGIVAGEENVAPLAGPVNDTLGGVLAGLTKIAATADVVTAELLSVARAVRL